MGRNKIIERKPENRIVFAQFHNKFLKMLESKKPSQLIKKLQTNEVELKVNFLDETTHTFSVKVSIRFFLDTNQNKIDISINT